MTSSRDNGFHDLQKLVHELQVHQVELELQNEELKRTRTELEQSRQKYVDLYDYAPVGYLTLDDSSLIVELNLTASLLLGETRKSVVGRSFSLLLHPDSRNTFYFHTQAALRSENTQRCEVVLKKKNGTTWDALVESIASTDGTRLIRTALTDITERKLIEKRFKEAFREKELLLKEINHRTKNNLAVVSSILSLQAMTLTDGKAREVLEECRHRVISMGMVHTKLYESDAKRNIDFSRYVKELVNDLSDSFRVDPAVALKVDVGEVSLDIDTAAALSLVVSELVTNSLKHGFPGGGKGEIRVTLLKEDRVVTLNVSDNGRGLPAEFDFRKGGSVGMELVTALVEQLEGEIELRRENGTEFIITFRAAD